MAQLAIPLILIGTAYLVSNDNNEDQSNCENYTNLSDIDGKGNLLSKEYNTFVSNDEKPNMNMNNLGEYRSYQDKYFINNKEEISNEKNIIMDKQAEKFQTLTGEEVNYNDLTHNNMTAFFSNKTNGSLNDMNNKSILDNYTGAGTYDIQKNEVAQLFKPQDNTQNVYGNQNNNDFLQSRMNTSLRHANTKPWEEVRVGPGLNNRDGNNVSQLGFNAGMEARDTWRPKTVDELRAANNPKLVYKLDNHMGPALNPIQTAPTKTSLGKIVQKKPDTYYSSNGLTGVAKGMSKDMQKPIQMMTNENRAATSVEYYGVKGNSDGSQYTVGEHKPSTKQQLPQKPFSNLTNNNIYPTTKQNYGKEGYKTYANNRTTTRDSHIGNAYGQLKANVIDPIVDGFRHTKKTNFVKNNHNGNVSGTSKQPIVYNPNEFAQTTNREMYECKLGMNHLNVQNQDATGYITSNPYLIGTQRQSMNQAETGPATGVNQQFSRNYQAEYNQRNNENRLHGSRINTGNMSLFNNETHAAINGHEQCNNRQNALYNPNASRSLLNEPSEILGEMSSMPQQYDNINTNYNSSDMLQAFKNNPYTQPLGSVA